MNADERDVCEQMQEDMQCILDGVDPEKVTMVCQVIVDHFKGLSKEKAKRQRLN